MWEDLTSNDRLVVGTQSRYERSFLLAEERENVKPEPDYVRPHDEGDDVEGHGMKPAAAEDKYAAASEEPPDVEGHSFKPKVKP